jgi:simple sugar transport system substrate-binding protein
MTILTSAFSRRRFLSGTTALGAAAALGLPGTARAQSPLTVGFIYVGPRDDFGYNQAHAEGAAAVKAMAGVTVIEEENVAETIDVQKSMESMINLDGASLIFPTSFGYFNPHILELAPKYPDVRFQHAAGLWTDGMPSNVGSYFGYIGMGQYLNGIVAGHMSQTKKIGFVAAKPIPQVLLNINSFLLGARAVDPSITCQVIFTGEWSLAVKEAEATNALADAGCDVITCHVDGPKVVMETAARRGAFICGYHADQTALAPDRLYGMLGSRSDDLAARVDPADPGILAGITGTAPGAAQDFNARLRPLLPTARTDFGGQAYDCVVAIALAVSAAGSLDPDLFALQMRRVVGEGGVRCTTFAECRALLESGQDIDYDGPSGPIEWRRSGAEPAFVTHEVWRVQADGAIEQVDEIIVPTD